MALTIRLAKPYLHRYIGEWDYKWNTRKATDAERMSQSIPGITGKRSRKKISPNGEMFCGREALGIQKDARSRLQKLAALPKPELKAIATKIQQAGGSPPTGTVQFEIRRT